MIRWMVLGFVVLSIVSACTRIETCAIGCEGCCDATGKCLPGNERDACGVSGAVCQQCYTHTKCGSSGVCELDPLSVDGGGAGGGTGGGAGGGGGSTIDAGPTQYPDGGSLFRYWDGGSCSTKTDCPCFSSDDCGPGFYCHSEDTSGLRIYCIPGARGAGLVGEGCAGEADCLSALCTDSADAGMVCSALCASAVDCNATLPRCITIGFGVDRSLCSP